MDDGEGIREDKYEGVRFSAFCKKIPKCESQTSSGEVADLSDYAGVTAYSFPPRKRAPAHKFARIFVHHTRKCAPWCSFSRGTYQRICSPRNIVHQAEAELEPAAPNTCLLCRSSCTTKARAEVTVFRCNSRCASFKTKWRCCAVKPSCGVEVAVCGRKHIGLKTNIAKHSSRPQASTQWVRCDPLFICLRFRDVLFSAESVVSSQG